MKWKTWTGKTLATGAWTATTLTLGLTVAACLSRPVGQQPPTTKVNFTSTVSQQAVDKVDLLFAIDNSASMADKQEILADAVPDLINGLLKPRCVDAEGRPEPNGAVGDPGRGTKENHYLCPTGYDPEFKPVIDMHIGIVSSSLGNFGGDVCPTAERTNDRGHLIAYGTNDRAKELAKPSNFLSWFPQAEENNNATRHPRPANPIIEIGSSDPDSPNPDGLIDNFRELVIGTGQDGCGLEAQLESFYRFLIQPDPWDKVSLTQPPTPQADLGEGVDSELLQQRADFLRPDSLVAIIMLTDEDDSSSDPLAVGGQGYAFMTKRFPGSQVVRATGVDDGTTAPRATSKCATDPGHADCTSCGFKDQCNAADPACQRIKNDPNCLAKGNPSASATTGNEGFYGPEDDAMNVRFHRMKERYGVDPQYPVQRYIDGLTKFKVPDRKAEHVTKVNESGRRDIAGYTYAAKCTNPLFAAKLPRGGTGEELCNLPRGTRSPDLVFFAVVGGVPNELLYPAGYDPNDPEKNRTTNDKWISILGRDPLNFNYDGIDSHMIQSVLPRRGLSGGDANRGDPGSDKIHGREWNTKKEDLQYACSFDLKRRGVAAPRECTGTASQDCDCADITSNNPLCNDKQTQLRAKAYPTIRELEVVRAVGDQGIAASLCPIQLDNVDAPDYGYRPAVAAIIDRLKNALTTQCLPQKLIPDNEGLVPCLVLAQLGDETESCDKYNMAPPPEAILKVFRDQQRAESGDVSAEGAIDLSRRPVCVLEQRKVAKGETCRDESNRSWCYVENDPANKKSPAGRCPQALIFSGGTTDLAGARFSLQCIQQFAAGEAAKDPSTPQ